MSTPIERTQALVASVDALAASFAVQSAATPQAWASPEERASLSDAADECAALQSEDLSADLVSFLGGLGDAIGRIQVILEDVDAPGGTDRVASASITEAPDTLTATGAVPSDGIDASGSITEAADTATATGAVRVQGAASIGEADDTAAATGVGLVPGAGSANITEAPDTATATGAVKVQGGASIGEDADTVAASGVLKVQGAASIGEAADTSSATGTVTTGFYSPYVYNFTAGSGSNMANTRAGKSGVLAGTGRMRVGIFGDSTSAGWGAGVGDAFTGARPLSWPDRLGYYLTATHSIPANVDCHVGNIDNAATLVRTRQIDYDGKLTGTTMISDLDNGTGFGPEAGEWGRHFVGHSIGEKFSFTPSVNTDTAIYWATGASGDGALGDFTINVNGGSTLGTIDTGAAGGSNFTSYSQTATLGANTWNAVTSATRVLMAGGLFYNSANKAVDIINLAVCGQGVDGWAASFFNSKPCHASFVSAFAFKTLFIKSSINELLDGMSRSSFKTYLGSVVDTYQAASCDVVICSPHYFDHSSTGISIATQTDWRDAAKEVADAKGCVFIDFQAMLGSYSTNNAGGRMFDALHTKSAMQDEMAVLAAAVLAAA